MLRRTWLFPAALAVHALTGCGPGGDDGTGGTAGTTTTTTETTSSGGGGTGGTATTGGAGGAATGGAGGTGGAATGGAGGTGGAATGGTGGAGGGMAAVCGDGALGGAEACDDGNTDAGDGCSPACTVESGFDCNGEPSVCAKPLCDGVQSWAGPTNVFPACFEYVIDQNYDANNCEFHVDVFGRGSFSVNGASGKWLEADLRIGAPEGTLKAAGMLTRYLDAASAQQTAWSLGAETSPGVWHTGFTWERAGLGPGNFSYTVVDFAFFIDVQHPAGDMVRLWISNGGANYTVAETYAVPGTVESMGSTTIEYAADQAPLFDQKHACAP